MLSMSRAGLGFVPLILFFALYINLIASAPVPERLLSLVERYDYDIDFAARSLDILLDREFDVTEDSHYTKREYPWILDDREFDMENNEDIKREYDDLSIFEEREFNVVQYKRDVSDIAMLRRRSFWGSIKSGFQRVGNAIKSGFKKVGNVIKSGVHKVQSAIHKAGGAIKNGFRKVGQVFQKAGGAVKSGFQKVGGALKSGFQKVGQGLRTAGNAIKKGVGVVGTAIKNNIGKVAKFGLKALAAGASVAAKVVKFVPGIGTGISLALKGVAKGANLASDKIHANLGGQLDKISSGMDYVINPLGSVEKLASGNKALAVAEELFLRFAREQ